MCDQVAAPYFDPSHLPIPPFRLRVALASAQMLSYGGNGRFELNTDAISKYTEAFKMEKQQFSKHYRSLVPQATAAAHELVDAESNDEARGGKREASNGRTESDKKEKKKRKRRSEQ